MSYALRMFSCAGCGAPVEKRAKSTAEVRCITCAIERAVVNVHQQRARCGEFYERWAAGIARAAREAQQLVDIGRDIDSIG